MILNAPSKFLESEKLKAGKEILDSKIRLNIQQIEKKQRESSQSVDLESLNNVLEAAKKIVYRRKRSDPKAQRNGFKSGPRATGFDQRGVEVFAGK